jgi:hypothetical protein
VKALALRVAGVLVAVAFLTWAALPFVTELMGAYR